MFDIMNRGNTITATLVIDGVQTTLTSYAQWTANAPYVGNFTGTMNGSPVSIKFSIDMDGTNPVVTSADIPGHQNAVFDVIKETSKNLVECFNGTYSTTNLKPEHSTCCLAELQKFLVVLHEKMALLRETNLEDQSMPLTNC